MDLAAVDCPMPKYGSTNWIQWDISVSISVYLSVSHRSISHLSMCMCVYIKCPINLGVGVDLVGAGRRMLSRYFVRTYEILRINKNILKKRRETNTTDIPSPSHKKVKPRITILTGKCIPIFPNPWVKSNHSATVSFVAFLSHFSRLWATVGK